MVRTKEEILEDINRLKESQATSLTPFSRTRQLLQARLTLEILEYLLISDTARKLD